MNLFHQAKAEGEPVPLGQGRRTCSTRSGQKVNLFHQAKVHHEQPVQQSYTAHKMGRKTILPDVPMSPVVKDKDNYSREQGEMGTVSDLHYNPQNKVTLDQSADSPNYSYKSEVPSSQPVGRSDRFATGFTQHLKP